MFCTAFGVHDFLNGLVVQKSIKNRSVGRSVVVHNKSLKHFSTYACMCNNQDGEGKADYSLNFWLADFCTLEIKTPTTTQL